MSMLWQSAFFITIPFILSFPSELPVRLCSLPGELDIETNEQEERCGPNAQDTQEGIGGVNEKVWHKPPACSTPMLFCSFK